MIAATKYPIGLSFKAKKSTLIKETTERDVPHEGHGTSVIDNYTHLRRVNAVLMFGSNSENIPKNTLQLV